MVVGWSWREWRNPMLSRFCPKSCWPSLATLSLGKSRHLKRRSSGSWGWVGIQDMGSYRTNRFFSPSINCTSRKGGSSGMFFIPDIIWTISYASPHHLNCCWWFLVPRNPGAAPMLLQPPSSLAWTWVPWIGIVMQGWLRAPSSEYWPSRCLSITRKILLLVARLGLAHSTRFCSARSPVHCSSTR